SASVRGGGGLPRAAAARGARGRAPPPVKNVRGPIMRIGFSGSTISVALAAAAASAVVSVSVTRTAGQAARPARIGTKPNFSGIWQANNEAHWDLQAHEARPGAVTQPG